MVGCLIRAFHRHTLVLPASQTFAYLEVNKRVIIIIAWSRFGSVPAITHAVLSAETGEFSDVDG